MSTVANRREEGSKLTQLDNLQQQYLTPGLMFTSPLRIKLRCRHKMDFVRNWSPPESIVEPTELIK